ncbi:hypothetical protein HPP92_027924 [Vanilla planifolia]|uniref:non-specific serine/threonine protein kinase n=3 Tax=Vanilla planifolia TaxID=51239 RepID=A0A835P9W2_VANPL|nr:hypothetical protein HPP92_027924 [Vanilla planifolia]
MLMDAVSADGKIPSNKESTQSSISDPEVECSPFTILQSSMQETSSSSKSVPDSEVKSGIESSESSTSPPVADIFASLSKNSSDKGNSSNLSSSTHTLYPSPHLQPTACGSPQRDSTDGSSSTSAPVKRHTGHDNRWEAIQIASSRDPPLGLAHFRLLKRLGYGDIGSVYLVELKGTNTYFAMKLMDRASIITRNKLIRAQTEREILGLLDHPFLPTLYSHFETDKFYCLVMEYCSGGNLHSLRQKQTHKYFTEQAARPRTCSFERKGHIMLSDFDLSLRCSVNPTLVKSSSVQGPSSGDLQVMLDSDRVVQGCIQPTAFFPRILPKRNRKSKSDFGLGGAGALPELMAEPTNARSMSFVGTHEYLAPEIIRGEGHGSAVDWWTFGIFLYELIYGTTPFKGSGNRATLFNVVGQPLRFPEEPAVSSGARDLIRGLLVKDPQKRIAYRRGATEIKQHPFFEGVNWALVRSMQPPHVPEPVDFGHFASKDVNGRKKKPLAENGGGLNKQTQTAYLDFEYF